MIKRLNIFCILTPLLVAVCCVDRSEVMSVAQHESVDFQIVTKESRPDIKVGDLLKVSKKHCVKSLLSSKKFLPHQMNCHTQPIGEFHVLNTKDSYHFGIEAHPEFLSLREATLLIEKIKK